MTTVNRKPKIKNPADHDPQECSHRLKTRLIHQKVEHATESKNVVSFYDNEQVRTLIVPERNPTELAGIWPMSEFKRLQEQAHVVTLEEKKEILEETEKKRREEIYAADMRKEILSKAQIKQDNTIGTKLSTIESDAKQKSEYLLKRSHELLNEQDDRVKAANCIILATKCRAIRNAQIREKELMTKQLQAESRRLDNLMEQSRQKSMKGEEKRAEFEENKVKRYANEIKQQIKDNELEKLLEAEKLEDESRMLNRALIALRKEDEEKLKQQKENQRKVREELHQANLDMERYKLVQKEEQRVADLRIQEFMRQKAQREEKREAELQLIKLAKEREIARLRALQQVSQDRQALMNEMQSIRIQEEVERSWREKEKEVAIKKAHDIEVLHNARLKQIDDNRRAQAIAIARDEAEFHKVAKVQQELFEKDQQTLLKKRQVNLAHRKEILKQINEKERQKINQVKEKFDDGKAFRIAQNIHDNQISKYIKSKIGRLKQEALSENYVSDIERQLKGLGIE